MSFIPVFGHALPSRELMPTVRAFIETVLISFVFDPLFDMSHPYMLVQGLSLLEFLLALPAIPLLGR